MFCLVSLSLVIKKYSGKDVSDCPDWFAEVTGKKVVELLKLVAGLTDGRLIIPPANVGVAGDFPVTVCANVVACHRKMSRD